VCVVVSVRVHRDGGRVLSAAFVGEVEQFNLVAQGSGWLLAW
jgi:hypothetical protein